MRDCRGLFRVFNPPPVLLLFIYIIDVGTLWDYYRYGGMGGTEDYRVCISRASTAFIITIIVTAALQMEHVLIFSSFAASIFIIVTMPSLDVANVRSIVGGHVLGFLSGVFVAQVSEYTATNSVFHFALSVGLATLLMNVFDAKHPPAAGTALGVSLSGVSLNVFVSVFTSIFILGVVLVLVRRTKISIKLDGSI